MILFILLRSKQIPLLVGINCPSNEIFVLVILEGPNKTVSSSIALSASPYSGDNKSFSLDVDDCGNKNSGTFDPTFTETYPAPKIEPNTKIPPVLRNPDPAPDRDPVALGDS
ncbi:hypothetical protein OGAPHI_001179 [Ogataea philodendri]|uniref:Uncharacterized protein n=1 Tax=Ogataea philodendri TaxID=1378263 RepID=A0A9P8PG67_9ASCO|nr:uncharacterized protein OGAPHI_001179 [Ogataea philodendri]KAH3670664.1 hypothetical protein OGAPHI_001179 [Ogataea philodendri]